MSPMLCRQVAKCFDHHKSKGKHEQAEEETYKGALARAKGWQVASKPEERMVRRNLVTDLSAC